jgi:acylphosphatase
MTEPVAKARIVVIGRVQGVFYRQSTKYEAQRLGLSGWVCNQSDGSVALEAVGARSIVEKLIKWCHCGPPSAQVLDVKVDWVDEPDVAPSGVFEVVRDR